MTEVFVKGEQGYRSRHSYVEFDTDASIMPQRGGRKVAMTFIVPGLGGLELEEMATMLAESVEKYNPGQGREAFESAVLQLSTRDFNGEWAELNRKIRVHKIWGGPVPSMLLLPDEIDQKQWNMMLVGKDGIPTVYQIDQKKLADLPPPEKHNAVKGRFGWESKPQRGPLNKPGRRQSTKLRVR